MQKNTTNELTSTYTATYTAYFWWFTLIHSVLWILLPTWLRYALPHDTIEGALWGQHLLWGYDKNPWMNAWLTRLGWMAGGTSGVGIYALSSIFVGISFWSVWKLGGKLLQPAYALIAVLLLEGCINYTLVPQSFNDNLIELGLWPLLFLCFYQALQYQKIRDWFLTGIIAGLALMAKYYTLVPLLVMLVFLLSTEKGRKSFQKAGIYIGLLGLGIIILPHLIWLYQHDFITVTYAFTRSTSDAVDYFFKAHFYFPFNFAFAELIDFILPLFLLFLFHAKLSKTETIIASPQKLLAFDRNFLLAMAFGPFFLTILVAIISGARLYNEWGVPLVSLWGIVLIALTQPYITKKTLKRFMICIYLIMFLWAAGYVAGLYLDKKHKHSDNYPAQAIANYVTDAWWSQYHKPLKYVAGSRYIAGYVMFYSKDHPSVYVEWEQKFSPWINLQDLKKYGAVFVQDNYYGTTVFGEHPYTNNGRQFPEEVLKRFPNLKIMPIRYFYWHRANKALPPIPVLIGFLPPAH